MPVSVSPRSTIARHWRAISTSSEGELFFISRFVDYASDDGLFRKYRVVFVDGRPYACHMAIADRWDIWYLNAGMSESAAKRLEEETFMRTFDIGFGRRHQSALAAMADRIGLDYFTVDCAETKTGRLLIFEADNTAVVHNMDSPELFPYKPPQMRKMFDAFAAMLEAACGAARGARGVTRTLREHRCNPDQARRSIRKTGTEIRALGHRMLDDMIDYVATIRERPVWQPIPDVVRAQFREELPRERE